MNSLSVVISAPSGAGKSTIIHKLLEENSFLDFAVSSTTRPPRCGEQVGKDYYYITSDEFQSDVDHDAFIEWAVVHSNYYGTTKKELDRIRAQGKIPLLDVDVQGARSLKNNLYGAVFIFILPPSLDELEHRLRNRKTDSEEQINIRLEKACAEIRQSTFFDYIVINNNLDSAVSDVTSIIRSSMLRFEFCEDKIEYILGDRT